MKDIDCKRILVSCQPRYWEDSVVNGIDDLSFIESKGKGVPSMPCAEQIKDEPTNVIYSNHWTWRPIIDVETGQIINWNKQVDAYVHYKVCDAFECIFQDSNGLIITMYNGYVPSFMYPKREGYGDYIILDVDECGYIQYWNKYKVKEFIENIMKEESGITAKELFQEIK